MIEHMGVESSALMEVAGSAVARYAIEIARRPCAKRTDSADWRMRFDIVVGRGNNGADGLVAARHLLAAGHNVRVWLTVALTECGTACRRQMTSFSRLGGLLATVDDDLQNADVVIDALLGTGSRLPLSDTVRVWTRAIRDSGRPVVAIDLPTGVDADSGQVDVDAVQALLTVCCGFAKVGLFQFPAHDWAGEVVVESLSMTSQLAQELGVHCQLLTPDLVAYGLQLRPQSSHKGSFGRVGVMAGSEGMYGAARLAVAAAYRAGAGLVDYLAPDQLPLAVALAFPVETLIQSVSAAPNGQWTQDGMQAFADVLAGEACALCGPGLGTRFVQTIIEHPDWLEPWRNLGVPMVLDADFLNALATLPDHGADFLRRRKEVTVLTPHPKEFAKLLGLTTKAVQVNRVQLARTFAVDHGIFLILKGAGTVMACPDGDVFLNISGNSGLASGGTGDVLAGLLSGLMASGYEAKEAMAVAVYVHGRSADLACERVQSEESLIASDVLNGIGPVFMELRKRHEALHRHISRVIDKSAGFDRD